MLTHAVILTNLAKDLGYKNGRISIVFHPGRMQSDLSLPAGETDPLFGGMVLKYP
jgi:hypothetical protein